jgi:hypothetical protein
MRILPLLGSTVGLAAVLGGGFLLRPDLLLTAPPSASTTNPVTTKVASTASSSSAADRQTVTEGMDDPITGVGTTAKVDKSILGIPGSDFAPTVPLPELVLHPPGPGITGSITTDQRNNQLGHTADWVAQLPINGPVRRVATTTQNGYVVVAAEAGELHLLCDENTDAYYVDTTAGEWRVYRVDGGTHFDVSYHFVQYDRSPLVNGETCK